MVSAKNAKNIEISRAVKKLRLMLGLTQEKFADHIGVSTASVVRYENGGRPGAFILIKLSELAKSQKLEHEAAMLGDFGLKQAGVRDSLMDLSPRLDPNTPDPFNEKIEFLLDRARIHFLMAEGFLKARGPALSEPDVEQMSDKMRNGNVLLSEAVALLKELHVPIQATAESDKNEPIVSLSGNCDGN